MQGLSGHLSIHCTARTTSRVRAGVCHGPVLNVAEVLFLKQQCCSTAIAPCVVLAILELCLAEVGLVSETCCSFVFVLCHTCAFCLLIQSSQLYPNSLN